MRGRTNNKGKAEGHYGRKKKGRIEGARRERGSVNHTHTCTTLTHTHTPSCGTPQWRPYLASSASVAPPRQ